VLWKKLWELVDEVDDTDCVAGTTVVRVMVTPLEVCTNMEVELARAEEVVEVDVVEVGVVVGVVVVVVDEVVDVDEVDDGVVVELEVVVVVEEGSTVVVPSNKLLTPIL
jgi:hypothetical protein